MKATLSVIVPQTVYISWCIYVVHHPADLGDAVSPPALVLRLGIFSPSIF